MGFSYRKSFKAGPIRVTASKSGISYSAGVKGARVTKRADGRVQTTLSAPGTGLRYTATAGSRPAARRQAPGTPARAAQGQAAATPVLAPRRWVFAGPAAALSFKGYINTHVTLYPDRIEITRGRLRRAVGQQTRTVIPWQDVVDIEVLKPSIGGGVGYVRLLTVADRALLIGLDRRRQVKAASKKPGTIIFSNLPGGFREHERIVASLTECASPIS